MGKIHFVHFRDVQGDRTRFHETFHDDGKTDMYEAMRAYYEVGFDGIALHTGRTLECSTIVQPIPLLAETCVDILLKEDRSDLPSLICLPVSYAQGGTTLE